MTDDEDDDAEDAVRMQMATAIPRSIPFSATMFVVGVYSEGVELKSSAGCLYCGLCNRAY